LSVDQNVALAYRVVEEIWNGADLDVADVLFAPAYVNHGGLIPNLVRGPEAIKMSVTLYRIAFPDLHITVEHMIAEKNLIAVHWTAYRARPGHLTGVAKAGNQETVTGMTLSRVAGGRIVESWTSWDTASVLSRLRVTTLGGQSG
jgi:predicted SnoaL-like aldol condensation-catalyzing enzyme